MDSSIGVNLPEHLRRCQSSTRSRDILESLCRLLFKVEGEWEAQEVLFTTMYLSASNQADYQNYHWQ